MVQVHRSLTSILLLLLSSSCQQVRGNIYKYIRRSGLVRRGRYEADILAWRPVINHQTVDGPTNQPATSSKPHDIGILRMDDRGKRWKREEDRGFKSHSIQQDRASVLDASSDTQFSLRRLHPLDADEQERDEQLAYMELDGSEPEKAKRSGGDFVCPICESQFTRKEGVNYHFPSCVEKYGNPLGKSWNEHPSCSGKDEAKKAPASKEDKRTSTTSHRQLDVQRVRADIHRAEYMCARTTSPSSQLDHPTKTCNNRSRSTRRIS